MFPLVLAALLLPILAQGSGEPTLEKRIERFLAGEETQSAAIRSAGPSAMGLLRPHRANLKANDLMREIRQRAASEEDRKIAGRLAGSKPALEGTKTTFLEALDAAVGKEVRTAIDPREFDEIIVREVTPPKEGSGLDVLEDLCAQAKVDFAYLYGVVLVAAPGRLWPPPPPRTRALMPDEKARAKSLVARLGAESPEDRDKAAAELRTFGPPVLPVLKGGAADRDAEVSGRCRGLIAELRPAPPPVFGPPAVEKQTLGRSDAALYASLKEKSITYKVKDLQLANCVKLLLSQVEGSTLEGTDAPVKLSFSFENLPVSSVLAIMTQCSGTDFMIRGGQIVVGPRDEILRRIAEK